MGRSRPSCAVRSPSRVVTRPETRAPAGDARRAAEEAVRAAGGGEATSVDFDRENGATWEVEVTMPDGSRGDVLLDANFKVIRVSGEKEPAEKPDDSSEDGD